MERVYFEGHCYKRTVRNCHTPERFGSVIIYTEEEYNEMSNIEKSEVHPITEKDIPILKRFTWRNR